MTIDLVEGKFVVALGLKRPHRLGHAVAVAGAERAVDRHQQHADRKFRVQNRLAVFRQLGIEIELAEDHFRRRRHAGRLGRGGEHADPAHDPPF